MKKWIATPLVMLLTLALLAACSSPKENAADGSKQNVDNKPFIFLAQQDVTAIDPAKSTDEMSLAAILNTYDPLVYPVVENNSMQPGPHIAEKWGISEDAKTYTFTIRKGVKFQSGSELTADDVVFSMKRMLTLKQGYYWLWSDVLTAENVKAKDGYTVEFVLDKPHAPFLASLIQLFIVDSQELMKHKADGEFGEFGDYGQKYLENNTLGSGPYRIAEWERGSKVKFEYFPEYWKGWKDSHVKNPRIQVVAEEATVKTMLVSGDADLANQWLSLKTFEDLKKVDGVKVQEDASAGLYHLPLNTKKAPLDDMNVRKAILHGFDYKTATEKIMGGAAIAKGPVSSIIPGFNSEVMAYEYDPELAKEYLAKSKYAGQPIEIDFMYIAEFPEHRQIAALLQANMEQIGIKVNLKASTWANIVELTTKPDTTPHLIIVTLGLRYPSVDYFTYGLYHPSSFGSYRAASWYENKDLADVLEKARGSAKVDDQMEFYKQAQKIIVDNALSVYIANPTHRIAYRDHVEGYKYVGLSGFDLNFYYMSAK